MIYYKEKEPAALRQAPLYLCDKPARMFRMVVPVNGQNWIDALLGSCLQNIASIFPIEIILAILQAPMLVRHPFFIHLQVYPTYMCRYPTFITIHYVTATLRFYYIPRYQTYCLALLGLLFLASLGDWFVFGFGGRLLWS